MPKIATLNPRFPKPASVPCADFLQRAEDLRVTEHNRAAAEKSFQAAAEEMADYVSRQTRTIPPKARRRAA